MIRESVEEFQQSLIVCGGGGGGDGGGTGLVNISPVSGGWNARDL